MLLSTLPKFNMEPENDGLFKRNLLFQGAIFRFHVKLWEGKFGFSGQLFLSTTVLHVELRKKCNMAQMPSSLFRGKYHLRV